MSNPETIKQVEQTLGLKCVPVSPGSRQYNVISPTGVKLFAIRTDAAGEVVWCEKPEVQSWFSRVRMHINSASHTLSNVTRPRAVELARRLGAQHRGMVQLGDERPGENVLHELEHYFLKDETLEVGYHSKLTDTFVRFEPPRKWSTYHLERLSKTQLELEVEAT